MSHDELDTAIQQDIHTCEGCGVEFDLNQGGYYVDGVDVGEDAAGGTACVFRVDTEEQMGNEWTGFEEEDIGAWCETCSWPLQRKREKVV